MKKSSKRKTADVEDEPGPHVVGRVTPRERDEIRGLFERKNGLNELVLSLQENERRRSMTDETVLARPADRAIPTWRDGQAKSVTFIVTEDCQLRCRYCYIAGKNPTRKMTFEVARTTIDYLLRERARFWEKSVVWDFIGGEPFLEIDLIDRISDYAKLRMYETNHPWFDNYRFSISTNGLLYGSDEVQRYITKNHKHLSIGISIDGTRRKHDAQRVFPNGRGSYDAVAKNIPLWLAQFPAVGTKATVAHDDLPYVKDSVAHLFELGIRDVSINVVFEDVWQDGDDALFEAQLRALADHIVDNDLDRDHRCSFFVRDIGAPVDRANDNNWCGVGKMLAVDGDGNFYPCVRFAPYALTKRPGRCIGNCFDGIDGNRLRPFLALTRASQSAGACMACDVASGCAWCSGCNYDLADAPTVYRRATFICKMHKARVRANEYYWARLERRHAKGDGRPPALDGLGAGFRG